MLQKYGSFDDIFKQNEKGRATEKTLKFLQRRPLISMGGREAGGRMRFKWLEVKHETEGRFTWLLRGLLGSWPDFVLAEISPRGTRLPCRTDSPGPDLTGAWVDLVRAVLCWKSIANRSTQKVFQNLKMKVRRFNGLRDSGRRVQVATLGPILTSQRASQSKLFEFFHLKLKLKCFLLHWKTK